MLAAACGKTKSGTVDTGSGGSAGVDAGAGGATDAGSTGGVGGGGLGGQAGFGVGLGGAGGDPVACQDPAPADGGAPATVAVDLGTVRSTVGPDMTGLYTAVYDPAMQNPTTPFWLDAAGITSLRYPGGSYSDLYHWSTHTGTTFQKAGSTPPTIAPGSDFGSFIGLLERTGAHAMITVNYGSNLTGNGPGAPEEAAAWVAYANGDPGNTTAIGVDAAGTDWQTVGYWAGLRAAAKLASDDGHNFLRIGHPAPVGIKYWEIGNELYGNGFYYGVGGGWWEEDRHPATNPSRLADPMLSPATYGASVKVFAAAMKAVDPTIKIGGIVHWPYTEFLNPNWNAQVLGQACGSMDFAVNHWYAGASPTDIMSRPGRDIPLMFSQLHATMGAAAACAGAGATMPIAVTEWGPQYLSPSTLVRDADTQAQGLFAASSYAHFMEQGALSVHWLEMHADSFLGATGVDTPSFGYHGALMGSLLATAGDAMVTATVSDPGTLGALLEAHASQHADGSVAVMLVNSSPSMAATVTVNITGTAAGADLPCVGTRYGYEPAANNMDGTPTRAPIFSKSNSVVVSVPAEAVVDVVFPKP